MLDLMSVPDLDPLESRRARDFLQASGDEYLIVTEAHHRMKNTLALLAALLGREFTPVKSKDVRQAVDRFEARIVAFAEL
jgi:two-component sensor histidine kinase